MESPAEPDAVGADAVAGDDAQAADAQGQVETDEAKNAPPRFPKFGTYDGLAPAHLSPFAIETNVSRIAQQIAEGRPATYD